jgi:drug/metabolite transporter (DMT)-like permease
LTGKSWLKFSYLGIVWGATFLWIKVGLEELAPLTFTALRLGVAVFGLFMLLLILRPSRPRLSNLGDFLVLGVFNIALPFALITWSEQHISSGLASILNSTAPLFTMFLAAIFVLDDRISLAKAAGLLVGFGGVILLVSNELGSGFGDFQLGQVGMLAASLSYSIAIIYARRRTFKLAPVVQALGQNVFANLVIWSAALSFEGPFVLPKLPLTWLAIVWLGIMATCFGTVLYYSLLSEVGPTRTTLVTYLFPLVGVFLGVIFLNEALNWQMIVGGLLIISGVVVVNARSGKPKRVEQEPEGAS